MSKRASGEVELRQTSFDNHRLAGLGVEVMTMGVLRQRVPSIRFLIPERVDFFMLLLIHQGHGVHLIDFQRVTLQPGSLVFVQPGQVQQWQPCDGLEGTLVMVDPVIMDRKAPVSAAEKTLMDQLADWPSCMPLSQSGHDEIQDQLMALSAECSRFDANKPTTPASIALDMMLARTMLTCLLLRVARVSAHMLPTVNASSGVSHLVRLLTRELESQLRQRPTVQGIAARLGYSSSTLNRACIAVQGRNAKQVIDHRIALEAQRLLVHSSDTTSQIGVYLGFSEPTNFLKFFKRTVGCTPDTFRRKYAIA